jgi:hypothetical protein
MAASERAAKEEAMRLLRSLGVWALASGLMLAAGSAAWAQSGSGNSSGGSSAGSTGSGSGEGGTYGGGRSGGLGTGSVTPVIGSDPSSISGDIPPNPQMEESQAKMRNSERQKQLVADTQKLLALANELKSDVDKSTKDQLSLDVIRKAEEIEKLAHSVRDKMKNAS